MKKLIYIVIAAVLFSVACEKSDTNNGTPAGGESSLTYFTEKIADHDAVVVKPVELEADAPVVVILTRDVELRTLSLETPNINFKAAEHCLIGRYALCVIAAEGNDVSFLPAVKATFPEASKFYLLSYRNGLAYTVAMRMPDAFAAYGCISGAIDAEVYKNEGFQKPVSFVHVHGTENAVYKWEGTEGKSVAVPLSIGAVAALDKCVTFTTSDLLPREGKGRVSCTRYIGGQSGCDVMLYSVESANSGWCDEEFEVYNQVWNFLKKH